MFTHLIVQPIFNVLVLVYALIPGHNFGLSIIIFTVIVRLLMWPLVKRQLRQTKLMRKMQPDLKRIKKEAKGDKQKESVMMMELYKERGVNPLGTIPILIVQLVVLIGLYSGLRKVIDNPQQIVNFAYPSLRHMSWMQHIAHHAKDFDNTLFGVVNLSRSALGPKGTYIPGLVLVIGSAGIQFLTGRQLMTTDKNARKLRDIFKAAGSGEKADQAEINAAAGRNMQYLIPFMVFIFTVQLPSALSLYWLTGGLVAYVQQTIALREDESDMEKLADAPSGKDVSAIPEAEIVSTPSQLAAPRPAKRKKTNKRKKR